MKLTLPGPAALLSAAFVAGTLRADQLPPGITDFAAVVRFLVDNVRLDGVFTDHPDRVRAALNRQSG